jgi:phospholipid-binding lipoprotein MlaA
MHQAVHDVRTAQLLWSRTENEQCRELAMTARCFWAVIESISVGTQAIRRDISLARGAGNTLLLLSAAGIMSCASQQGVAHRAGLIAHHPPSTATASTGSLNQLMPWQQAAAPLASADNSAPASRATKSIAETPADRQDAAQESTQDVQQTPPDNGDELPQAADINTTPYDPLSPLNQKILAFNVFFDDHVGRPAGAAWAFVVPYPARLHIRTFFRNTAEPKNLVNCMLQSRFHDAGITLARFSINSTLGVAGFFDVAQDWFGLQRKATDFGLTEAHHSVTYGPYLMAPVGGPTSFRDAAGSAVDGQMNALVVLAYVVPSIALLPITAGLGLIAAVNERSLHLDTFDDVNRYTVDLYGAVQDYYYQRRNHDEAPPGSSE